MSKTVSIPMAAAVQVPVGEVKSYRYLNLFGGDALPLFFIRRQFFIPKGGAL